MICWSGGICRGPCAAMSNERTEWPGCPVEVRVAGKGNFDLLNGALVNGDFDAGLLPGDRMEEWHRPGVLGAGASVVGRFSPREVGDEE